MIRWVRVDYANRHRPGALRILADKKGRILYERPAASTNRPDGRKTGCASRRKK